MKRPVYMEGVAPHKPKESVSTSVRLLQTDLKPEVEVLQESIVPSHDEEQCVFPEEHKQIEERINEFTPGPIARYIVMAEILGKPKCRR